MRIVVLVAEVGIPDDEFGIENTTIAETDLEYELNEWDDYAVETAVQLKEEGPAEEIVAVTIGPERVEETIRMALAKGADRAIRIWDDALADTDLLDVEAKTNLLAAAVDDEDPTLVLTGVQTADDAFGATGVSLADELGFQWGAVVSALDVDAEAGVAHVHRELEGGLEELTDIRLPAVLTIQTGINEPRYASLRGIRQAQSKELALKDLDDVDIDARAVESDLVLTSMYEPESESDVRLFEGDVSEASQQLAEVLRKKGVAE